MPRPGCLRGDPLVALQLLNWILFNFLILFQRIESVVDIFFLIYWCFRA